MVITEKFVYIHMPKTGGTFVTSVLQRLHNPTELAPTHYKTVYQRLVSRLRQSLGHATSVPHPYGPIDDVEPKHGTCHDIPEPHQNKLILSCMRNPYDWYVSQYEFGWWKRTFKYHPEAHPTPAGFAIEQFLPEFKEKYPHFPDISFQEFVDLCYRAAYIFNNEFGSDLGLYTHSFTRFYYREPKKAISLMNRGCINSRRHREEMFDICFIKTDRLNQELYDFLLSQGYCREDLRFLPGLGKILPMDIGRKDDQNWEKYYTPDLKKFIREKDWALFEMFPEFDVH